MKAKIDNLIMDGTPEEINKLIQLQSDNENYFEDYMAHSLIWYFNEQFNINLLDKTNSMKPLPTIFSEIVEKWKDLSQSDRLMLARRIGGIYYEDQVKDLFDIIEWENITKNMNICIRPPKYNPDEVKFRKDKDNDT